MKNKFKVATFNLWKDCGEFPRRIEKIGEHLKKLDCICFQEDYHSEKFSSSDHINQHLDLEKTTLTLRKKSRNGVISSSNLTILSKSKPKTIEEFYFDKGGDDERGAIFATFKIDSKNILIINTHLTNFSYLRRVNQIYSIKEYIDTHEYDLIILCGDMNFIPTSKEAKCIQRYGFIDYNTNITHAEGLTLDYIFSKGKFSFEVKSKILIQNLSDHYCLQNKFIW